MIIHLRDSKQTVTTPADVNTILQAILKAEDEIDRDKEHFWVFQLDARNKIKVLELVSLGTLTSSIVHPREVFTRAITNRCAAIVIAHNHPSGELEPSDEDKESTRRLVEAGEILGIKVVDHVIVVTDNFVSMKQQGLM